MKNKDIEHKIREEVKTATPDVFEKVAGADISTDSNIKAFETGNRKSARLKAARRGLAAACAAIVVGLGAMIYSLNAVTDSSISIDVNPSIEIITNKRDKVIKVNALNEDAEKVIGAMKLDDTGLDVTVNELVRAMVEYGYISADKRDILVTVENKNEEKAKSIRDRVDNDITEALIKLEIKPNLVSQTADRHKKNDDIQKQADENGISYGKALMISKLREKYPVLADENLEAMSTHEILLLLDSLGIKDYDDIFDVDDANELYCDDCGKLKTECRKGVCADDGDYCEICGAKEGGCVHSRDDDDDDGLYCDDCGKLKTECRKGVCADDGDYCEICGAKEGSCVHSKDDDDDDDNRTTTSTKSGVSTANSKTTSEKADDDNDDDSDGPYCDDCGKLKTECRKGICADDGDYCEICGKKEGSCSHTD